MGADFVIQLGQATLLTVIKLAAPMLCFGLVIGLIVSVLQAATQIQEQTLAFIPKILAVFAALLIFGPWMLRVVLDFTQSILGNLTHFVS
jgi:flagellar biosynthesis protein FliQ